MGQYAILVPVSLTALRLFPEWTFMFFLSAVYPAGRAEQSMEQRRRLRKPGAAEEARQL
uniref:Uncharacterized protein n=1 Tax=uncultured Armatimonadetes bacterium TaxID=157466 RepID=A0A6J4H5F8_9BACT|nr:hypothetical protein AVDCRST_MAG63-132 [uncultured Armatimonadetes bacterium]